MLILSEKYDTKRDDQILLSFTMVLLIPGSEISYGVASDVVLYHPHLCFILSHLYPQKHPEYMLQVTQDVCENTAEITVTKLAQQNYLILGKKTCLCFGMFLHLEFIES